jgi:hypothetical protein
MKRAAAGVLQKWPVSNRVNSSRAPDDDPTLIERIAVVCEQRDQPASNASRSAPQRKRLKMRSRDEILAELREMAKTASASEKEALRKRLDRIIESRMRLVSEDAQHAFGGLTPRYQQVFQDMIANQRLFLSELERIRQELNSD